MEKILASACLLGQPVRFDGRAKSSGHPIVDRWRTEGRLVSVCPEVAGGLPIPRPPAEIEPLRDAAAVLRGEARIRTPHGADVTEFFLSGAESALRTARKHGVRMALLKEGSPSCGVSEIYDGAFSGVRIAGVGVTTAVLRDEGIAVFSESEIESAQAHLDLLESAA